VSTSLLLVALGWSFGWYLWGRPRRLVDRARSLRGRDGVASRPVPATVIIPARDEARVIGPLLDDLLAQEHPPMRVVVVDDHSTDGTAHLAAARGAPVQVVATPALPPGWTGKSWACHVGATAVDLRDDELLVFCDADVRLAPDALDALCVAAADAGGATSVQPFHRTERPGEQLSLFCGLVALMALGAGRRDEPPSGLSGPVIATTTADYRRAGGHDAVRAEVIEDVALGQRYRDAGLPVSVLLGGRAVRYRMYPAGLGQLVEGWTKNLASGAGAVPRWRTALTVAWITALGSAAVDLVGALVGTSRPLPAAAALYAACCVQVAVLGRRLGTFGIRTALVYPVPLAAFVGLFARSTWRTFVHRSVVWRGRTLPVGERAR
jgi:4,4'-diaponeurosporenoate glycosyltransferase